MIKDIIIKDVYETSNISLTDNIKQNVWLSILDPEDINTLIRLENNFKKRGLEYFSQCYYDWSEETPISKYHNTNHIPQKKDIVKLINFLKQLVDSDKEYSLGINCHAGMCRSTAAGVIAWCLQGLNSKDALQRIVQVRPIAWPNNRMLKFAQDILENDIYDYVQDWKIDITNNNNILT